MKFFLILLMCIAVCSCSDDDNTKEEPVEEPVVMDLTYLNGSTVLGDGVGSSLETDTYIQCHTLITQFIPKFLKNTLVAFGASSGARCSNCTLSYNCVPGETVTLEYLVSDSASSPVNFEADIMNAYDLITETATCPESGVSTIGEETTNGEHLKVTVSGQLGSDTEYLDCFDL